MLPYETLQLQASFHSVLSIPSITELTLLYGKTRKR